jgi:filamentous hemagglutinin family protein
LFHSFGDFNVPHNNIANFLNDTGLPTSNILGRVTGGDISNIFGTIQTTGFGNANLFLMNPAGFLFGPNATVNVGGMVAFTSADYLRLSDNARFNTIPNTAADALLTPMPVAAFGFLGFNPEAITVQGSQFTVTDGQSISLVGGDISIGSGTPDGGTPQPAQLSAPNGNILLASTASPGEFAAATLQPLSNLDGASFTSYGSIELAGSSSINISGASTVSIRGGQFVLLMNDAALTTSQTIGSPETITLSRGSSIIGSTSANNDGGVITINSDTLAMDGAAIKSTAIGPSHGMDIAVTADQLELSGGAQIASDTGGTGTGGDINVSVRDSVSISGYDTTGTLPGVVTVFADPTFGLPLVTSGLFSSTSGSGNGGHISISNSANSTQGPSVTLDNAGQIATLDSGSGRGGDIALHNIASLTLENGAQLFSSSGVDWTNTAFSGIGPGGNISVIASDQVRVSGGNLDLFALTQISSQSSGIGDNGHITLHAPLINFESGGRLTSSKSVSNSDSPGLHGDISIVSDSLTVSGAFDFEGELSASGIQTIDIGPLSQTPGIHTPLVGGNISVSSAVVSIDQGFVGSTHQRLATGGNLIFDVGDLNVTQGGSIRAQGDGTLPTGRVTVTASGLVEVSGVVDGTRSTIENVAGGVGHGSDIAISAHQVLVSDGGRINSETRGLDGLNISISADESVIVSTGGKIRIGVGDFDGGALHISAPSILLDQGILQTSTVGTGSAGSVLLTADHVVLGGGQIRSETEQTTGTGGNITIHASETISISGQFSGSDTDAPGSAGIFARSFNAGGNAGNASLTAPIITVADGGQINSSTSSASLGGDIFVNANTVTIENGGTLSAKTSGTETTATGGSITVTTTNQVMMTGGASITTSSTGPGNAGNIDIDAGSQFTMTDSSVTTESTQSGGGAIKITTDPSGTVLLTNSTISASVLNGAGGGGSVNIDPLFVILVNSQILATSVFGPGGEIFITTNLLLTDATSVISADSPFGVNGTVTIQSPNAPISGQVHPLGKAPLLATSLLNQQCASVAGGQFSSFTVAGRNSLPTEPGSWLTSPLATLGTGQGIQAEGGKAEGLSRLSGVSDVVRAGLAAHQINQTDQIDKTDQSPLSLRQIAPAGFLTRAFSVDEPAGCQS